MFRAFPTTPPEFLSAMTTRGYFLIEEAACSRVKAVYKL